MAMGYGLEGPGFDFRQGQEIFLYSNKTMSILGLTQPPIQRVQSAPSLKVKWSESEADHSPSTRRTLLPRNIISFMFLVLGPRESPEGLGKFKNSPHLVSNPRPSDL
jgi:hypothetical protein